MGIGREKQSNYQLSVSADKIYGASLLKTTPATMCCSEYTE